jgi:GNAT superfamily N-acetyltransferase
VAGELEIRPLLESDDRSAFTCGQAEVDRFFHHYAGQNQFKLHLSVTYLAVMKGVILGFATVTVGSIERAHLPPQKARLPAYPLPVLRLARLGVDLGAQKLGVGSALLRHVLLLSLELLDSLGCVGVVTDAKPDAASFYSRYGFASLQGVREGALQGDPTPMFLSLDSVPDGGA